MKTFTNWYLNDVINERWAFIDNLFTEDECTEIIDMFKNKTQAGKTGQNKDKKLDVRRSNVHFLNSYEEDNFWIFERVTQGILYMNTNYFDFNVEKIEALQFSEYSSTYKGFFNRHVDQQYSSPGSGTRKLSFSILLSNKKDFVGGDLLMHLGKDPESILDRRGRMAVFPSYTLHEVTPVSQGIRYALVGWVCGPKFK